MLCKIVLTKCQDFDEADNNSSNILIKMSLNNQEKDSEISSGKNCSKILRQTKKG